MEAEDMSSSSPLLLALMDHRVEAEVIDIDHYRIQGGMAVETDYIIQVQATAAPPKSGDAQFETFLLSKTYSAFRTLGSQLQKAAHHATVASSTGGGGDTSKSVQQLAQYCETVLQLVEAQRTQYLGKVNYNFVKVLAKKRCQIIKEVLDTTLRHFPRDIHENQLSRDVARAVEIFFLSDFCMEGAESAAKTPAKSAATTTPLSEGSPSRRPPLPKIMEPVEAAGEVIEKAVGTVGRNMENLLKKIKEPSASGSHRGLLAQIDTKQETVAAVESGPSTLTSPVVPYTRKARRGSSLREKEQEELKVMGEEANLLLDDERPPTELVPNYSRPVPNFQSRGTKLGDILENNPFVFVLIGVAAVIFLKSVEKFSVTMDFDILLLLIWAAFCVGLHTPRPMVGGVDKSMGGPLLPSPRRMSRFKQGPVTMKRDADGRKLLRMSMAASPSDSGAIAGRVVSGSTPLTFGEVMEEDDDDEMMATNTSPLPTFPTGAPLGSKLNCWSEPENETFHVRGKNYLEDKIKIKSSPFLFPIRGCDLFLTDLCPAHVGTNNGIRGGKLREKPTFLINFRLPWGVFISYFEIPERFVPFLRAGHERGFDQSTLPPMESFSGSDLCIARFLLGSQQHKNETLKIVPVVVVGPWVVKSVVGGKPAIIGNKLPVKYYYEKAQEGKACYLEADLDIVSSSAARGILSVTRSYTQVLTLDLGFVVQGNSEDELPEQMLVGARLHGIDPLTAPPLSSRAR